MSGLSYNSYEIKADGNEPMVNYFASEINNNFITIKKKLTSSAFDFFSYDCFHRRIQ